MTWVPEISLRQLRANLAVNGPELYVGTDGRRLIWAGPQQAMLVLGPPRSGKTSSLVVPNVLAAPGPVLVTCAFRPLPCFPSLGLRKSRWMRVKRGIRRVSRSLR